FDARRTDLPTTAEIALQPQPDDVLLMGFESPLAAGRSVVAFQTEDPANMSRLFDAWFDPTLLKDFQGSVVVLQQNKVTSLVGNQTYYVGHLPLPTWLRWYFSHHPVWLALTVVLLALLLALAARVLLRRHTAERLNDGGGA
ncbi:cellulose biosynthesis cyclic di-GMP-binding regulatory protein BcsB, partial [Xanthomonas perforans]|nr:cellulose biosynthesis cyclic di-GMP-binding regulatory protein BcsB [Xanthomonas perforans]